MDIRSATIADIPELSALIQRAYRGEESKKGWTTEADFLEGTRITPSMLKSFLEKPDLEIFVYRDYNEYPNGRILGCVQAEKIIRNGEVKCWIGLLTVSPELQSKGIGKKLLRACEEWAKDQKCASLYLRVISSRDSLIAWYEREGFINTGETEPFPTTQPDLGIAKVEFIFDCFEKRL